MTSLEDRDAVIRLVGGYMVSDAIRAAVRLGVFAHLHELPGATLEDLAARTGAPAAQLDRILNLLRYAGLIEQRGSSLHNSRLGMVLVPGKPGSLAAFAENFTSPLFQR
ncbi:MAG: helix-turn-helix domain-containing protein, partial [Dietzia sp.]|nr:helix-turn-helix domain-containing protein [Dietzia sp.]